MKKRKIASVLALTMTLSMTACGSTTADTADVPATETVAEVTETPQEATEAVAEETEATEEITADVTAETELPQEATETEPETEEQTAYSYTDMNKTMYAQSSVNVRDLPDTGGNRLGGLSANQKVNVTGQCNETGWYRLDYNGGTAYVSGKYLADNKAVVNTPPAKAPETPADTTAAPPAADAGTQQQPQQPQPQNPAPEPPAPAPETPAPETPAPETPPADSSTGGTVIEAGNMSQEELDDVLGSLGIDAGWGNGGGGGGGIGGDWGHIE